MEYKYKCKPCDFQCNTKSRWEKHISTELHKTGKRKQRSDYKEPFKCEKCGYTSKNTITFKKHVLNEHSDKATRAKEFPYYCKYCNVGTFSKDTFALHNNTKKHKDFIDAINEQIKA